MNNVVDFFRGFAEHMLSSAHSKLSRTCSKDLKVRHAVYQKVRATVVCAVFLGVPIWLSGCTHSEETENRTPQLPVMNPQRKQASITRDYVCQIRAIQHIELKALERGYVESIHVDEGQAVKAGQLMFEIMPRVNQAELRKAEAEAQFREIEYQNTQRLTNTKITAPSELALAQANLDKAKAELTLAQVHVDFTQVKAPFDGIMGRFNVRNGSLVEEGEILTTLSDNHQMWVYFNVPEAEYIQYQHATPEKPMKVRLQMADHSIYPYAGEVTAIEADFNNQTGNIAFRATFPNPEGLLRHGQTGTVLVDTVLNNAMLLPQKAVFDVLDKRFVVVVDDAGKIAWKEVKVGAQLPDVVAISEGLSDQDKVLIEGQNKVHEGDTIVPVVEGSSKVMASLKVYAE